MRINNNLMAINTHRQMGVSNIGAAKSMEKLSSGFRINRAGDDAAGLAISEKMRGQIRGVYMASRNAQDTISLIQTAEGALGETHEILQRMRELAVQAANDTNTDWDRRELQAEMTELRKEVDRIANSTEFNTRKLLEGSAKGVAEEIAGAGRVNNNSVISMDSIKVTAMQDSIARDKSWAFDGAFMMIKTSQSFDANGSAIYNANDYKLVGPDGMMYDFRALGNDTAIKSSELEEGTIIADGGSLVTVDNLGTIGAVPDLVNGITLGAPVAETELSRVAANSVLASGSSFMITSNGVVTFGGSPSPTGAAGITYTDTGVLQLTTNIGRKIDIPTGKSITLDDGTILRNNGGGKVTVECGSLQLGGNGLTLGANAVNFTVASQSVLDPASVTAKDGVTLVWNSNLSVAPGIINTNVTIGNGVNLTSNTDSTDPANGGDIVSLSAGSVLARGSSIEMIDQSPTGITGQITTVRINVNGNEVEMTYDVDMKILKVGNQVVAPGQSITLDDGVVLSHTSNLDTPNAATGKITVEAGRLVLNEKITADTEGTTYPNSTNNNVKAFTVAKDSVLAADSQLDSGSVGGVPNGTKLMAGTVISPSDRIYPGSVTMGHGGTNIQFSANVNNSLASRYFDMNTTETITFIFSRYEAPANDLRNSIMAQIGASSGQTTFVSMGDMRAEALNVHNVDISTKFGAATAIETVNNALQRVSHQRALLGATQNRLEHTIRNLDTAGENMQAAESRIRDVDMAKEIMEYTKNSILQQSAQAMLAQANQVPQNVLQLLR